MKLKTWFSNQLIQTKLILINVLVLIIALSPVLLVMSAYEFFALRKATLEAIHVNADIVSDNAASAMAFNDNITATEALATLQASSDILYASLALPDGTRLATFKREGISVIAASDPPRLPKAEEQLTWDRFKLTKPVFLKSEFVGTLSLEASLNIVYKRIFLYIGVIAAAAIVSLFFSLSLAIKLESSVIRPLKHLRDSVKRVTQNQDYSVRPMIERTDEIGDLSRAFYDMMCKVQERDDHLKDMAFYDGITGLPNRHFFEERVELAVSTTLHYQQRCSLLFIDLDDFKIVNDTLGHHIGDDLLRNVGQRLQDVLRHNDMVFRIGGDEFAVILEDIKEIETATIIADKIIKKVSQPVSLQGHQVKVGASIGISVCPDYAGDTDNLLKTADSAMYVAKAGGKNTYHLYTLES
jgi:diguanylate cyclase (GGDEF)-like protein